MALTEAQRKADRKYKATQAQIAIRVSHEDYDRIQAHASARGESLRAYILGAVAERMGREDAQTADPR